MRKRWRHLLYFGILMTGLFSTTAAQQATKLALKAELDQFAKQIEKVSTEQDQLFRKKKKLDDNINSYKQRLQKRGNPLVERQLQNDLKASRVLADQIQALDGRIYRLTEQSVETKKRLVDVMNTEIEQLSREADATKDGKQKRHRLRQILQLQEEKEACQAQIRAESHELLLELDITLAADDGPDEIQQKLAIVQDQQDTIRTKIQRLSQQIQETQNTLILRRNMLEVLQDIRRGEDDEFDLDRSFDIAELEEEIADAESTLELIEAKKASWHQKEKVIAEKAKRFVQEAQKLIQPVPKGDSLDTQ